MKKRSKYVFVASIILMSLLIPFVLADWSEDYINGDWGICERISWMGELGEDWGGASWSIDVENFTGYNAQIRFSEIDAWRDWWWIRSEKRISILWNFSGVDGELYVLMSFMNAKESFGFVDDDWIQVGVSFNGSAFFSPYWWNPFGMQMSLDEFQYSPFGYAELFVYEVGENVTVEILNHRSDTSLPVSMWKETFACGSGWSASVHLTQKVGHSGSGVFDGFLTDTYYQNDAYDPDVPATEGISGYTIHDFINDLIGVIENAIPSWLREYLNQFAGFVAEFWVILQIVWGMVIAFLPVLGTFYFISFIGVFFTGVVTGNINLLQTYVEKQWMLASSIFGTIVSTVQTIWNFIKFW